MLQAIAKTILRVSGWTTSGAPPEIDKAIYVGAFHTSNWDAFWLLVFKFSLQADVSFLAKHTLFWWPLGPLLRAMGAMPIDRSRSASTVQHVVDMFRAQDRLWFGLSPEGTRQWKPYWKTGFYRMAKAAEVPIVLCSIDYAKKHMQIGPMFYPDDEAEDIAMMREFYRGTIPRHPHSQGPIAFPP